MPTRLTLAILASFVLAAPAAAATLTVNSAADDTTGSNGLVTLREAVAAANADATTDLGDTGSGADTIVFDPALAGATIALATAADTSFGPSGLAITSEVTIDGGGAPFLTLARDGAVARLRLFFVSGAGTLRLERITLADGAAIGFDGGATHRGGTGGGGAGLGGAVLNLGTLEIVESTLTGNQAIGGEGGPQSNIPDTFPRGGSGGGGTAGDGGAPTGGCCAFDTGGAGGAGGGGDGGDGEDGPGGGSDGSPGGFGGGAGGGGGGQTGQPAGTGGAGGFGGGAGGNGTSSGSIQAPGGGGGGGAGLGGAVFNHGGDVTVVNSTFSGNSVTGGAGGRGNGGSGQGLGGAVFNRNGTLEVLAATFTGNGGGAVYNLGDGGNADAVIEGTILADSTGGNDFVSNAIGGGSASAIGDDNLIESESGFSGSVVSTADPQLGALTDNGGPTETHEPAAASPAVDAVTVLTAPATDQRGETRPQGAARDVGSVERVDNQPPVAVCQDVEVEADGDCLGHATAADVDGGSSDPDGDPITLEISPAGPFPLGDTAVELTVTDDGDLSDTCAATVTVVDVTPPVVACPADAVLECPADTSPAATGFATADDNCSVDSVVFADLSVPGCGGTETVTRTWTATDGSGNQSSCVQTVETVDTTPPVVIPGPDDEVCLWPPNHKFAVVEQVTAAVAIIDACDPAPFAQAIECASDQCDDAPCAEHPGENGDGNTVNDCVYDPLTDELAMRSERAGTDPEGRTYGLSVTAADDCGNVADPVVVFTGHVPHHASPGQQCLKP